MVENFPSKAGDMGSIPRQGTKIPHVPGQLSPVPQLERPVHHNKDPAQPKLKKKKLVDLGMGVEEDISSG